MSPVCSTIAGFAAPKICEGIRQASQQQKVYWSCDQQTDPVVVNLYSLHEAKSLQSFFITNSAIVFATEDNDITCHVINIRVEKPVLHSLSDFMKIFLPTLV